MPVESMRLSEIAELLGGELHGGDPALEITAIQPVEAAGPGAISFISNPKYVGKVKTTAASAVLVTPELAAALAGRIPAALLAVEDPYMAFARLMQRWFHVPRAVLGVSERAYVDPTATLGADVNVHPLAYVGPRAVVGDRVDLHPGAYVGADARIGEDTTLGPNAVVHHACRVGARCHVYAGAVVGSDGFGFAPDRRAGLHVKIPQVGIAVVDDDVEIGANTTIDRAVLGETRVGRGTKIDNLVQLGHNAQVGGGCFLVSQSGVSGTSRIGDGVTIAGQAGVAGHLTVGDGAQIGAQAGIHADVPPGARMLGSPAIPGREAKRAMAVFARLPDLRRRLRELERRLADRSGAE